MGMGMMVYRSNGVRLHDGHRGNSGDGDSIHSSTAVAVTELTVDVLFVHGLKSSKEHYRTFTDRQ